MNGLAAVVSDIVMLVTRNEFPNEVDIVEVEGAVLIEEALAGVEPEKIEDAEEFRFGVGDAIEGLKAVALVLGTAKTILDLRRMLKKKTVEREEVVAVWKEKLIEAGMEENRAAEISKNYVLTLIDTAKATGLSDS